MDRSLARERLIGFVAEKIVVVTPVPPLFVGQVPISVGLKDENDTQWYDEAEALGAALADDAGFRAIQLGTWLNSPDGEFISEAVGQVLPPNYRPEYQLVVDALKFAAARQHDVGVQRAVGVGVLAVLAVIALRYLGDN